MSAANTQCTQHTAHTAHGTQGAHTLTHDRGTLLAHHINRLSKGVCRPPPRAPFPELTRRSMRRRGRRAGGSNETIFFSNILLCLNSCQCCQPSAQQRRETTSNYAEQLRRATTPKMCVKCARRRLRGRKCKMNALRCLHKQIVK